MENELSYKAYYWRALEQFREYGYDTLKGFKLVLGATGLGKTHGIIETLDAMRQDTFLSKKKAIYVAHRTNLIFDIKTGLIARGLRYVHLKSDVEIVKEVLKDERLKSDLLSAFKNKVSKRYIKFLSTKSPKLAQQMRYSTFEKHVRDSCRLLEILESNTGLAQVGDLMDFEGKVEQEAYQIMKYAKLILIEMAATQRAFKKPDSDDCNLRMSYNLTSLDYSSFLEEHRTLLYRLFPYLEYRIEDKSQVLLVTLQKLYLGFFDGEKTMRMLDLKDKVIFLDEFDFLESVLLDKICMEVEIDDPFRFIWLFHTKMQQKLKDKQYPLLTRRYKNNQGENEGNHVRESIEAIQTKISQLVTSYKFPDIQQFEHQEGDKPYRHGIFQSNYTSVPRPIYIEVDKEKDRFRVAWAKDEQGGTVSSFPLLRNVKRITASILGFFAELKDQDDLVYEELLEDVYHRSEFRTVIKRQGYAAMAYAKTPGEALHSLDYLYERGFGLYTLEHKRELTEPDAVTLSYRAVLTSPEMVLLKLLQQNMVFGLSATAHLTRLVEHFDLAWIRQQVYKIAQDGVIYFDQEEEDKEIIQHLLTVKEKRRSMRLEVGLLHEKQLCKQPQQLVDRLVGNPNLRQVQNNGIHPTRLLSFFTTLDWIKAHPLTLEKHSPRLCDTHLVFLNSIQQIKALLELLREGNCRTGFIKAWNECPPLDNISNGSKAIYPIEYRGQPMYLVLLNSANYRNLYANELTTQGVDGLFWQQVPVVVVTQFPSAANGVNLQYQPMQDNPEVKEDFRAIHFLEAPFHYFSELVEDESLQVNTKNIKEDVFKLAKLWEGRKISWQLFQEMVSKAVDRLPNEHQKESGKKPSKYVLSNNYSKTEDYILNQMARLIQALGRMERVRDRPAGVQHVRMTKSVAEIFSIFYQEDVFEEARNESQYCLSYFYRKTVSEAAGLLRNNTKKAPQEDSWEDQNRASTEVLKQATRKHFEKIRKSHHENESRWPKELQQWEDLRKALLRLDFKAEVLEKFKLIGKPTSYNKGIVSFGHNNRHDPKKPYGPYALNMDWKIEYKKGEKNPFPITTYFNQNGYPLYFRGEIHNQYFLPVIWPFWQGIIAEEVVSTILRQQVVSYSSDNKEYLKVERLGLLPHHRSLYEVADLELPNHNIYIDVKHYSLSTLNNPLLLKDDNGNSLSLEEELLNKGLSKLTQLRAVDPNAKLIFMNLYSDEEMPNMTFWSDDRKVLKTNSISEGWEACAIAFLPGVVYWDEEESDGEPPTTLTFDEWISDIQMPRAKVGHDQINRM